MRLNCWTCGRSTFRNDRRPGLSPIQQPFESAAGAPTR
jgi:hypothetical protein